jgi:uncharacterized protein
MSASPPAQQDRITRAVFDTNIVLSTLLFSTGRLAWLRNHWAQGQCIPLISPATAAELTRVLAYPKFALAPEDRLELLGDYLPFCHTVRTVRICPVRCRDSKDQPFLDLAQTGRAHVLITGDKDLLALAAKTRFTIQSPENYRASLNSDR